MNLTPTDDDDGMENLSNRNNLSGSYSNLFRDMLEDDDSKLNSTEQKIHQKDVSENVYSNIPTTTSMPGGVGTIHCSDHSEKSDPNLHVYSNIVETATVVASSENLHKSIGSSNIDVTLIDGSSTMISNDLDLDDPALAVATFGLAKDTSSKIVNEKVHKSATKVDRSSLNTKRTPKSSSMEMNQVIPQVAIIEQSSNGVSNSNPSISTASNSFCSPSRMRLLHDTTMIDTALDLDSLDDGSSVGNNSQACLVKTAIVWVGLIVVKLYSHTHKNVQSHRFKEDLMKGDEGKIVKPQIDSSQRRRMHFAKNFLLVWHPCPLHQIRLVFFFNYFLFKRKQTNI